MDKKIIIGVIVLAAVLIFGGYLFLMDDSSTGEVVLTEQETSGDGVFSIVTLEWEPHAYTDEEGIVQGISVDIIDRAFSRLNVPYEIRLVPWTRALKEVEVGEADAIMLAAYTTERDEFLHFTEEERDYAQGEPITSTAVSISDVVFFVRKQIKDSFVFESLEDIRDRGYRVGAVANYASTGKLHDAGIDVAEYPDDASELESLAEGVIDIAFQEKAVGFVVLKKMGLEDEITVFPQSFFENPLYMLVSKQSDYPDVLELREQVLDELQKIHESGEYDEIYNKYTQ